MRVLHDKSSCLEALIRKADRIEEEQSHDSIIIRCQPDRVIRTRTKSGQDQGNAATQARFQALHNILVVRGFGLTIGEARALRAVALSGKIHSQRMEAESGQLPGKANVQPVWTDPVKETGIEEDEDRPFPWIGRRGSRQGQNPAQPPAFAELYGFFDQGLVRHSTSRSRTGRATINSAVTVSQLHRNGMTSGWTPATGKSPAVVVLTARSMPRGTFE